MIHSNEKWLLVNHSTLHYTINCYMPLHMKAKEPSHKISFKLQHQFIFMPTNTMLSNGFDTILLPQVSLLSQFIQGLYSVLGNTYNYPTQVIEPSSAGDFIVLYWKFNSFYQLHIISIHIFHMPKTPNIWIEI